MALRLDLYALVDHHAFAPSGPDEPGWIGFVAASDDDEGSLVDLLEACEAAGALMGAVNHGYGHEVADVDALATVAAEVPLVRTWLDVISWAVETAAVEHHSFGWLTRYDRGGSLDDGTDEWTTSWSDAPTEGAAADTPWPGSRSGPAH
jgi:hypothetical protein